MKKTAPEKQKIESAPVVETDVPTIVEPSPLTPEQIEDLKSRAAKADENWERVFRTTADFEHFKKRAAREKQDAIKFANESLIQKLIPLLDNFDMALAAVQNGQTGAASSSLQSGRSEEHTSEL